MKPLNTLVLALNTVVASLLSSSIPDLENVKTKGLEPMDHFLLGQFTHRKAYEESLALISSLHIPPSCLYSALTSSVLSKCSSSTEDLPGEEKSILATKFAICEFTSAQIEYPRDCKGPLNTQKQLKRCIRALETRPQWWTTWSNCFQNVGSLCQAVRGEVERDEVLNLHQNLTKLHYELQSQLYSSLQQSSRHLKDTEALSAALHENLEAFVNEIDVTRHRAVLPLEVSMRSLQGLLDQISQQHLNQLDAQTKKGFEISDLLASQMLELNSLATLLDSLFASATHYETTTLAQKQHDLDTTAIFLEEMRVSIRLSTTNAVESVMGSMESVASLSNQAEASMQHVLTTIDKSKTKLDNINGDFEVLASTQERISTAMTSQQESSNIQFASMVDMLQTLNTTILNLISETTGLMQKIENAHSNRMNSLDLDNSHLLSTYLPLLISVLVLIDRKRTACSILLLLVVYSLYISLRSMREDIYFGNDQESGVSLIEGSDHVAKSGEFLLSVLQFFHSFWR